MKQSCSLVVAVLVLAMFAPRIEAQNIAIGGHVSTLGIGGDVAVRASDRSNLRGGFNLFSYARTFDKDGIRYDGHVQLRSVEAEFDWFPFSGSFHVSPGLMAYYGNEVDTDASVPTGRTFTLGSTTYISPAIPVLGVGHIGFNKVAPTIRVGWGNLVPRGDRRFSIPFEFGVVFHGTPSTTLSLAGNVCDPSGRNCVDVSNPLIQTSIRAEEAKIDSSISSFKVYPLASIGFGYRF